MNDIDSLREVLFATLRGLQDKDNPIDIDRAKAINDTAQVLINTAKVEIDFARATGQKVATQFLPAAPADEPATQITSTGIRSTRKLPGATITTHQMR